MKKPQGLLLLLVAFILSATQPIPTLQAQDKTAPPSDARYATSKTLNDYFPFSPPKTLEQWKKRRQHVIEQVLVANGLWPMPEKTPLNPVIHGLIKRDGYTIEKVFFESYPGFYVTGNLYRPTEVAKDAKIPGVLCPHGHWGNRSNPKNNGRFYEAGAGDVKNQIQSKAEQTEAGAKYPLQARCAMLAKMGCVVFHYDMIGYGDGTQIYHPLSQQNPKGLFTDATAELWQQNFMGLQTWNSIRALDFLCSLPNVDTDRLAVTGASGGGTQTFLLSAIDDRVDVAFPAVMVSTGMQGGCICENCSYLRLHTGNIELAGLFAPKPLAMSAANDWTKEIETKGLPQLRQLYALYDAPKNIDGKAWLQFGHNYNQVSREFMYNWMNQHLNLQQKTPVVERPFVPVPPAELTVFTKEHPRPETAVSATELRKYLTAQAKKQWQTFFPENPKKLSEMRKIVGTALRVMINEGEEELPIELLQAKVTPVGNTLELRGYLRREQEAIPIFIVRPKEFKGSPVVIWIHPDGVASVKNNGEFSKEAKKLIDNGASIVVPEVFATGSHAERDIPKVNQQFGGYTWGYNRTTLANRVHDIITTVDFICHKPGVNKVRLVGWKEAGPWAILASALLGDAVERTAADVNGFRFDAITSLQDPMMQPGALKYGGLPAFAALIAPRPLFLSNAEKTDPPGWTAAAYSSANAEKALVRQSGPASQAEVLQWLMK